MSGTILIYLIILGIVGFIAYFFFFKGKNGKNKEADSQETNENAELTSQTFEKKFFERVEAGEKSVLFLTLGNPGDTALIRSLLFADGIPSYVEGEHMNNIYGGISGTMESVVAVKLYVLDADYERAKEIFEESNIKKKDITVIEKK